MKKTQFFKKAVAMTAAGLLAVAPVQGVLAAESFTEYIGAQIDENSDKLNSRYNTYIDALEQSAKGAVADWTITLGDTGKMLASMFLPSSGDTPMDLNWLNDLKIHQEQSVTEDQLTANFVLSLNDTPFANLNTAMDISAAKMYMSVPELFADYVVVDMNKATEQSAENVSDASGISVSTNIDPAFMSSFLKVFLNAKDYLPDGETASAVIGRYMHMFFDRFQDVSAEAQTITAGGVAQEMTVFTGEISSAEAGAAVKEMLTAAKDDEDLKGIIEKISAGFPEGTDLYADFQGAVDSALVDGNFEGTEESKLTCSLNVDAEDKIQGVSVAIEGAPIVEFSNTADGDARGFACNFYTDGAAAATIEGAGEMQGDVLNGTYAASFISNGAPTNLDIVVENYKYDEDTFAGQGSYTISMAPAAEETDAEEADGMASMFSQFAIQFGFETAENAQGGSYDLSVLMSGSPVISLAMETAAGEGPAPLDISGIKAYDITDDADMQSFMATLDIGGFLNNLVNAGVPEELINSVLGVDSGAAAAEETPAA